MSPIPDTGTRDRRGPKGFFDIIAGRREDVHRWLTDVPQKT